VISALDDQGREIVAMGRGIGFQKKSGQEIKAAQVEKIFHLGSPDLQARVQELLGQRKINVLVELHGKMTLRIGNNLI